MLIAPPEILKVAREFLGFSQEEVEKHAGISRATIQRVERGVRDLPQYVVLLQHFYEKSGIEFVAPAGKRGWGLFNHNTAGKILRLNKVTRRAKAIAEPKAPEADKKTAAQHPVPPSKLEEQ
ncbi:helix-turn-helix transcriptional regulator [Rhizobium sp. S163]|uniref:helix-turn-helix domain-containing protein n=1 Tax=Rhizobium sp. S163 TaxID=3055039 RepID=UPI000DB9DF99|nr:helix-turn-helix transcriptional regulator [Rhizobium sp. S163]MDM9644882.1 helix-turn-helix transcriptional regulator [Rhizobium sp. S163]